MASVARNQKVSRHKNTNVAKKPTEKALEKLRSTGFVDSSSTRSRSKGDTPVSKVTEEKMSPAKQTISMFEELANQFILDEKPFAENSEVPENITVLKSVLAPDVASGVIDPEASTTPENIEDGVETENDLVSRQIEALGKMVTDMGECEEPQKEKATSEINETRDAMPKSHCNATLEEDVVEHPSKVTIEDLKAKIVEILSVPFPSESLDQEAKKGDINRIHDENMKKLKKKLRLDFEEDESAHSGQADCVQDKVGQFEIEISKHYKGTVKETSIRKVPCNSSKSHALQAPEMNDVKKIFGTSRPRPSKRKKSLVQCNVNDFTGEPTFNVSLGLRTPQLLESECGSEVSAGQDMEFEEYNTERDLIEMARRENEALSDDKIKITYIDNRQAKNASGFRSIFSKLFSCGASI